MTTRTMSIVYIALYYVRKTGHGFVLISCLADLFSEIVDKFHEILYGVQIYVIMVIKGRSHCSFFGNLQLVS